MGIIRDSFVIFKNWAEAINTLPEEYQLETYKALTVYGTTGDIPEDISAIAKAMLVSFSRDMENNILRYKASVENGQKGGRPKNLEKPSETQENLEKPSETQENLDEPNPNPYVNVNVNDINSQSINEKISNNAHARMRDNLLKIFKDYTYYVFGEERAVFEEIIDVLADLIIESETDEGLKFKGNKIPKGYFNCLDLWQIKKIVFQVMNNPEIENRKVYISTALINRVKEMNE